MKILISECVTGTKSFSMSYIRVKHNMELKTTSFFDILRTSVYKIARFSIYIRRSSIYTYFLFPLLYFHLKQLTNGPLVHQYFPALVMSSLISI